MMKDERLLEASVPRAVRDRRAWLAPRWLAGVVFVIALLLLWELLSQGRVLDQRLFPPVSVILKRFVELWLDNTFPTNLAPTLQRLAIGYSLAAALGIGLGTLLGYWSGLYTRVAPIVEFLRPMPPVAVIPIFMLFLGIGEEMKVASVVFGCVWPILLNTVDGVRGIHPQLIEVARMYQFSTPRTLRAVVLPAALPQIMAGLRTALAIALIVALVSEMIATTVGLGFFIVLNQRSFKNVDMFAGIFLLAILGYLLNRGFLLVESRVMAWHLERSGQPG